MAADRNQEIPSPRHVTIQARQVQFPFRGKEKGRRQEGGKEGRKVERKDRQIEKSGRGWNEDDNCYTWWRG